MKICPEAVELFHGNGRIDGETDMTMLRVVFRNSAEARRNQSASSVWGKNNTFLCESHDRHKHSLWEEHTIFYRKASWHVQ